MSERQIWGGRPREEIRGLVALTLQLHKLVETDARQDDRYEEENIECEILSAKTRNDGLHFIWASSNGTWDGQGDVQPAGKK